MIKFRPQSMKRLLAQCLLFFWLTACVSTTPYQISSHETDHSFTLLSLHCETTKITPPNDSLTIQNEGLNSHSISLLNWNVYKGSGKKWAADFEQLSQAKDIITLQEARLDEHLHQTLDALKLYWNLTTAFMYNNLNVGVLTAARVPPISRCSVHSKEPIIQLPKTLIVNLYPLSGSKSQLLVANIHSINFTFGTKKYQEQITALQRVIEQHNGPVIVAGDFNSWSNRRMQIITQFKNDLSLSSLPYQNHNRTQIFGNAIDHIFFRELSATKVETPELTSSDHNPIIVTFQLNHHLATALTPND
jgi:endonuclease/exonuclease/phosphatase (EEP) superfamily protein YafD